MTHSPYTQKHQSARVGAAMQAGSILDKFGRRIRKARLECGLSQEALGFEAGLDRTYVSSVERGKRNISLLNIHRLAKALGLKAKDLV